MHQYRSLHENQLSFLEVDWRLRPYEIVFLCFALICAILLYQTPLPLSLSLAKAFILELCMILFGMYICAILIVIIKALALATTRGWRTLTSSETLFPILWPYCSLDFLMRSIRRGLALLGTIFFFLHLKHVILWIHPANFDPLFWKLDRILHFGLQPNAWMIETLGEKHDFAILIDWLYFKYFSYKKLVCLLFLLELRGHKLAESFFTAYALLWSVGGLSYLVMPADGPCYALLLQESIEPPQEPERHRHLFKFPIEHPVSNKYRSSYYEAKIWKAKSYQRTLWEHRRRFIMGEGYPNHFYGIAAMPSLHVAAVTMIAVFLFKLSTLAGIIGVIYGLFTFIGSIFLQWHYAIDGYIGFLIGLGTSLIALRWFHPNH